MNSPQNLTYIDVHSVWSPVGTRDASTGMPLVNIIFILDDKVVHTERRTLSLIDAFTRVGGFMQFFFVIATNLITHIESQLFFQAIIRKMFFHIPKN